MAEFEVTTLNDELDAIPSDNGLSLREATIAANMSVGADTIVFSDALNGLVRLTLGEIAITDALTIDGGGDVTISGDSMGDDVISNGLTDVAASLSGEDRLDDNVRIFNASSTSEEVGFHGLTLTGGRTTTNVMRGGAVNTEDGVTLTISDSTIVGNSTSGAGSLGGAVYSASDLLVVDSLITGNSTSGDFSDGGGLFGGTITVTGSTIEANSTGGRYADGGGVASDAGIDVSASTINNNSTEGFGAKGGGFFAGGAFTAMNGTLVGNSTTGDYADGGAIFGGGMVGLFNTTVTGNAALGSGSYGGGAFSNGDFTLRNSIVLGNSAPNGARDEASIFDSFGGVGPVFIFEGSNIVGSGPGTFDASVSENVTNADAILVFGQTVGNNGQTAGVLADNGGFVNTVALNAISANLALDASSFGEIRIDARGVDTFDFPGVGSGGDQRDLGAFEQDAPPPVIPPTPETRSFVVTTTNDVVDAFDGQTSLREAITYANERTGPDTITFAASGQGLIRLTEGALNVTETVEVDGAGLVTITGDAANNDITRLGDITDLDASLAGTNLLSDNSRIFEVGTDVEIEAGENGERVNGSLILTGLTLTGGRPGDTASSPSGGAIESNSFFFNVQVRNSILAGNTTGQKTANGFRINDGGAISANSAVELVNSILIDNQASGQGGAVSARGRILATSSTITGNLSGEDGGALSVQEARFDVISRIISTNSIILGNVSESKIHNDITANSDIEGAFPGSSVNDVRVEDSIANTSLQFRGNNIVGGNTQSSFNPGGSEAVRNANPEDVFAETKENSSNVASGVLSRNSAGQLVVELKASETNPALDATSADFATSGFQSTDLLTDITGAPRSFDQVGLENGFIGGTTDLGAVELQTQVSVTPSAPAGPTSQADELDGTSGADAISGLGGADTIKGLGGADTLNGNGGRDDISGNGGRDIINGNGGRDKLSGGGGRDSVDGGGGRDEVAGNGGRDTVKGGGGRDTLEGGGGRDFLDGGRGNDLLDGSNGADILVGGKGNDVLTGGGGLDTFQFMTGDGRDRITDFDQFRDQIEILNGAESFDDLTITQAGDNVRISFSNVVIIVEDDVRENFTAADFVF